MGNVMEAWKFLLPLNVSCVFRAIQLTFCQQWFLVSTEFAL